MRISDEIIEQVKANTSIEDVISEYVSLRHAGQNLTGLCPFHSEKTPSFSVSPSKGMFYCFGCHTGGTVYTFLTKINNISFPEAVRLLAARAGISIPEDSEQSPEDKERENIIKLNEKAAYFFHFYLTNKPEGEEARKYLKDRNISEDTVAKFNLGVSPFLTNDWSKIYSDLKDAKYSDEIIGKSWLCRKNQYGKYYDYFRGRVIFPIYNVNNRIIAFGGRILPSLENETYNERKPAKYINTGETIAFKKSETLFGLNFARHTIRVQDEVIIVEGNFDVIMLHQFGINNVVAPLGTALTSEHLRMIGRYTQNILLVFDSDPAGEKATWRSIELLLNFDYKVRVLRLPNNMDPFDYMNSHNQASFNDLVDKAPDVFTYMIEFLKLKFDIKSIPGKMKLLSYIYKYLIRVKNRLDQDFIFKKLENELDVSIEALKLKFISYKNDPKNFIKPSGVSNNTKNLIKIQSPVLTPLQNIEREFLTLLLIHFESITEVIKIFSTEDFTDSIAKLIFAQILDFKSQNINITVENFLSMTSDSKITSVVAGILFSDKFKSAGLMTDIKTRSLNIFNDYKNKLHIQKLDKLISHLNSAIKEAQANWENDKVQELQADLGRCITDRNRLKTRQGS